MLCFVFLLLRTGAQVTGYCRSPAPIRVYIRWNMIYYEFTKSIGGHVLEKRTQKVAVGSDHAAYDMKAQVIGWLDGQGYEVVDVGTDSRESCDYPVFAHAAAEKVAAGNCDKGILICGSGIGMSMAANKVTGIRAALCSEPYSAMLSRRHNDSNILCLGARLIGSDMAIEIITKWLETEFEGGRHQRRVSMIQPADDDDMDL